MFSNNKMLTAAQTLQVVSFLDMLGAGLIMSQLHDHARQLGCSHLQIGAMGAVYSAAQLVSGPVIGNFSDLKGRKPTLLVTLSICCIAYTLLGFASSFATFITIRAILGFFKNTQLMTKSMTPDYESDPEKQAVSFGRLATISGLGMSIGPIASGHIVDLYPESGFTVITSIVGVIFAINTGLIKSLPGKTNETDQNQNKKKKTNAVTPKLLDTLKSSVKESIEEFHKVDWATYWDVFLFKLLITLSMGMYFNNYGVFLKAKYDLSPKTLGYIITFLGGVGSLSTYFIGYINQFYKDDKDALVRTFHMFVAVTISLIGMGLGPSVYFYILFVIPLSVAGSVGRVASLEMIMSKGHIEHRGSIIGASASMRSLAGVVTPILAGIASEYIGVTYAIFGAAAFSSIGAVLSYRLRSQSLAKSKRD